MKRSIGRKRWFAAAVVGTLLLFTWSGRCASGGVTAVPVERFLDSVGTLSAISVRGENLQQTIRCTEYLGIRWLRAGIEGNVPMEQFIRLHEEAGLRFSWGFGSGSSDLRKLIETGRQLAAVGALLAFEGPNEPNNWGITYEGEQGGRNHTWMPVAKLQRDLYAAVKSDPLLRSYPVWSISEAGAETDNVGLQFLKIPEGAGTLMPPGTTFADYVNVHNYIYHPNASTPADNKTWNAADPGPDCKVDGLYGEHGLTWGRHFNGYSREELATLPRVTTETGTTVGGPVTEELQGLNLLTMYLDQFKRGWSYTAVYLLRDRVDEAGNQTFGFYRPDYTPRKAAVYLHNLTSVLADKGSPGTVSVLDYSIRAAPQTVHDLLLEKSNGTFELVVWDEQLSGSTSIEIGFNRKPQSGEIHDPTIGTAPIETFTNRESISLTLTNHPVVIQIGGNLKRK